MLNLTNREKEIFNIMFNHTPWATAPQVAAEMQLSERTIEAYVSTAYKKNGVNSREDLYKLWEKNPDQRGYNIQENLLEVVINKIGNDEIYYIGNDKEFFFAAGIVYRFVQNVTSPDGNHQFRPFIGINETLKQDFTEEHTKTLIKKVINLTEIEKYDKIGQLVAGVLMYSLKNKEYKDGDTIFMAGMFSCNTFTKMLK